MASTSIDLDVKVDDMRHDRALAHSHLAERNRRPVVDA